MMAAIFAQTFLIRERKFIDDTVLPETMDELGFTDSYRKRYNKFLENIVSDSTDIEI